MTRVSKKQLEKWKKDNPDLEVPDDLFVENRPHKYHATRVEIDGITFDSQREAKVYSDLRLAEQAGEIEQLELQPKFILQEPFTDLEGNKYRAIIYIADFKFIDKAKDIWVVVDVKGYETPVFKIKKKLFLKKYGHIYLFEVWK